MRYVRYTVIASIGVLCLSAQGAFQELRSLPVNSSFCYEQYQLPFRLRSLLTIFDVIKHERGVTKEMQMASIDDLLSHYVLPPHVHYVSREYAHQTYQSLDEMCNTLGVNQPLLFIATQGEGVHGARICFFGGKYYGLILGSAFLRARNHVECRAVIAYKLAQVARRDCEQERINAYVWPGVVGGATLLYVSFLIGLSIRAGSFDPMIKDFCERIKSSLTTSGLLFISWLASHVICAHLSRKYARQADTQALLAFQGNADQYAQCLYKAHIDEQQAHEHQYQIHKKYHHYVRNKLNELRSYGIKEGVIAYLEQHIQASRRAHRRMQHSSPLYNLLSKRPALEGRIEHIRSIALKDNSDEDRSESNKKK